MQSNLYYMIGFLILVTGLAGSLIFSYVAFVSLKEKEFRTYRVSVILSMAWLIPFLFIYFTDFPAKEIVALILLATSYLFVILILLPINPKIKNPHPVPKQKYDERDVMFSRNELISGTTHFEEYYAKNPE
ncbi:MAG: hypothetical protein R6V23_03550, partial [Bacteroidales bacterium]